MQQLNVLTTPLDSDAQTQARIERVLHSAPMATLRAALARSRLTVQPQPIVCKYLPGNHLRLMFPVTGGEIEAGSVVSIVCLYDCVQSRTLYAHAMHAGPDVNPLLKHLDGPMANPKAQTGADGERATRRIIQHKQALWHRFLRERATLGSAVAGRRWRAGYYWSLKRLYYCTRCTPCRWGSPFFDGPDRHAVTLSSMFEDTTTPSPSLNGHAEFVSAVLASEAWGVEVAYAGRGGFRVSETPRLITPLENGFVQLVFETNARLIQAGTLVALSVTYDTRKQVALIAHCLCAGPEAEIQFLRGDVSLGLPTPQPGAAAEPARALYATWRREAWFRFWVNELDAGIAVASAQWIDDFWNALETLFGGNDLSSSQSRIPPVNRVPQCATANDNGGDASASVPVESVLSIGGKCFAGHASSDGPSELRASEVSTLMVNLGRLCNQTCRHCHIDAGPHRTEEMDLETVDMVLDALRRHRIETLDITGGAPEMNPHFRYLVREATGLVSRIVDRCNLTILSEPGYEDLADFLARNGVEITASLPCYEAENVDYQRGRGTFQKSIAALQQLNALGYAKPGTGLALNLVYNPIGDALAPPEEELEHRYKRELSERFNITFNRLFAMNNMPIARFHNDLVRGGKLPRYTSRMVHAFNPQTLGGLMCRHMVSVGWDGRLHDCDFNQALGIPLGPNLPGHIRDFDLAVMRKRSISTGPHCFACAAGSGSSCSGALIASANPTHEQQASPMSCGACAEQG